MTNLSFTRLAFVVLAVVIAGGGWLAISRLSTTPNSGGSQTTTSAAQSSLVEAGKIAHGGILNGTHFKGPKPTVPRVTLRWGRTIPRLTAKEVTKLKASTSGADAGVLKGTLRTVTATSVKTLYRTSVGIPRNRRAAVPLAVTDEPVDALQPGGSDSTAEPSVASGGGVIMETGNWFASISRDGGATWTHINPYAAFGQDFCCDQVVLYDPARDVFLWLLQFDPDSGPGYLKLAVSSRADMFSNPCVYTIKPTWFSLPDSTDFDYNDTAITQKFLYLTTNLNSGSSSADSIMARFPLDDLAACKSSIADTFLVTPDVFTLKPAMGSPDTMYFGTNNVHGHDIGSWFRVYRWADNSDSVTHSDTAIDPYQYENSRRSTAKCGSADGVVTNWCEFNDSRVTGGALGGGHVVFAFNAGQNTSRPFPYARIVTFNASDLSYVGDSDLSFKDSSIQFPSLAANSAGQIGGIFAWGGGTAKNHWYPGVGAFILGTDSLKLVVNGGGNACKNENGVLRWGDYLTVRGEGTRWRGAGYILNGGNCGTNGSEQPHTFVFGT